MARNIKLSEIGQYAEENLSELVRAATLETDSRLKTLTPVDTGRLRASWQKTIEPLQGSVFNNLPYAAPVVAGVDLPASWQGQQRTVPFLDLVAKDIQTWVTAEAERIARSS